MSIDGFYTSNIVNKEFTMKPLFKNNRLYIPCVFLQTMKKHLINLLYNFFTFGAPYH